MVLLLFILACFGLTQILIYGKIFDSIRPKHYFFHCSMCIGFWVGLALGTPIVLLGGFGFFEGQLLFEQIFEIFAAGCISSGTSYALCSIFSDDGININHN